MTKPGTPPLWMELTIDRSGEEIRVSARGSRGEQIAPRALGQEVTELLRFATSVQQSAARSKPLAPELLTSAQALQQALLGGEIGALYARLREAAGGPLLMRLMVHDPELQAVPWEALCKPGEALGFWASSTEVHPVRGVTSGEPWRPREVDGAVRVLAIAPVSGGLATFKGALADRIASGEVEWLDPMEGGAVQISALFDRLGRKPIPHVLHFLGHGGVDKGMPALRLADSEDGEESWLQVELLAQRLDAGFRGLLRLVVLEACEGARPGAFASAAEILARSGIGAVVAHLWPVKSEVARVFSGELHRALAGAGGGDVAAAVNKARQAILWRFSASAEALSPVLYLRGDNGRIFDFEERKVTAVRVSKGLPSEASAVEAALVRMLGASFSLVLGDRWKDQKATVAPFRDKLRKELAKAADPAPEGLPMSALAQRFLLRRGAGKLDNAFEDVFLDGTAPPIVSAMARLLGPGVHTTLLRSPWLENSLAEQQPDRTIYVLQPEDEGVLVMKREGGGNWEELDAPPSTLDVEKEILLLRPYRGYTLKKRYRRPLLTEDDYYLRLPELLGTRLLPEALINTILRTLRGRPALILGMSMLTGHHRMLLHSLYERLPRESIAVVEPEDRERTLWESGAGLPGKGVAVVEATTDALCAALLAIGKGEEGEV